MPILHIVTSVKSLKRSPVAGAATPTYRTRVQRARTCSQESTPAFVFEQENAYALFEAYALRGLVGTTNRRALSYLYGLFSYRRWPPDPRRHRCQPSGAR